MRRRKSKRAPPAINVRFSYSGREPLNVNGLCDLHVDVTRGVLVAVIAGYLLPHTYRAGEPGGGPSRERALTWARELVDGAVPERDQGGAP